MGMFVFKKIFASADLSAKGEYLINGVQESEFGISKGQEDYYFSPTGELGLNYVDLPATIYLAGNQLNQQDYVHLMKGINPASGDLIIDKDRLEKIEAHTQQSKQEITSLENLSDTLEIDSQSERKENVPVIGFSTAFSASKSISLLYASLDNDSQKFISESVLAASTDVMQQLKREGYFSARVKENGINKTIGGEPVTLSFLHHLSRPTAKNPDPHLHVHVEIPNYLICDDGKTRTIDFSKWLTDQKYIGALFDVCLSERLEQHLSIGKYLNRDLEKDGLKAEGFSEQILREYSQRREQIENNLAEHGLSSFEAKNVAQLTTKESKNKTLVADDLLERWRQTIQPEQVLVEQAEYIKGYSPLELEAMLFAGKSIIKESDLKTVAARLSVLNGGLSQITQITCDLKRDLGIVDLGVLPDTKMRQNIYTTREMLALEQSCLDIAKTMNTTFNYQLSYEQVDRALQKAEDELNAKNNTNQRWEITGEQKNAARTGCVSSDFIIIEGRAGTGKTTGALLAVTHAYRDAGYEVVGCAPPGVAAKGLEAEIKVPCSTIHSLLMARENGRFDFKNKVVIVDEAGMLDTRTMQMLTSKIQQDGGKVILTGDTKQLESVGSAGILRDVKKSITENSVADIQKIIRQKNNELLTAVKDIYDDHSQDKFITTLRKQSMMHDALPDYQTLTNQIFEQLKTDGISVANREKITQDFIEQSMKKNNYNATLFLSSLRDNLPNKTKLQLNKRPELIQSIAEQFKKAEAISADFDPVAALNSTVLARHKMEGAEFWQARNNLILCDTNAKVDFMNDTVREQRKLQGEVTDCRELVVTDKKTGESLTKEFGVGDRIMFLKNKRDEVSNGQMGHIVQFNGDNVIVQNNEGKQSINIQEYGYINHAYAMTVHKAQGVTCDKVFYLASELTNRSQTLVAISRAKHESHVFTHSHAFCENNGIKTLSELTKNFEYKMTALEALHLRNARATDQEPIHFGSRDIKDYSVAETISKELNQKLFGREYQSILQKQDGKAASQAQAEVVKQDQQQYEKRTTTKLKQQLHAKISEIKLTKEQLKIRNHPFYLDPTENQTRRRKGRRI